MKRFIDEDKEREKQRGIWKERETQRVRCRGRETVTERKRDRRWRKSQGVLSESTDKERKRFK